MVGNALARNEGEWLICTLLVPMCCGDRFRNDNDPLKVVLLFSGSDSSGTCKDSGSGTA